MCVNRCGLAGLDLMNRRCGLGESDEVGNRMIFIQGVELRMLNEKSETIANNKNSNPATGQLVEELLVQRLTGLFRSHAQKYISSDELVYDLAVGRQTLKPHILVFELHLHLFDFPVHVPGFHGGEIPGLQVVAGVRIHSHQTIRSDAE